MFQFTSFSILNFILCQCLTFSTLVELNQFTFFGNIFAGVVLELRLNMLNLCFILVWSLLNSSSFHCFQSQNQINKRTRFKQIVIIQIRRSIIAVFSCVLEMLIVYSIWNTSVLLIGDTIRSHGDIIIIQGKCELFGDHYEMTRQAESMMIQCTYLFLKYIWVYYWLVVVKLHFKLLQHL